MAYVEAISACLSFSLSLLQEWSVGKVIDTISQKYGLRNHNDQSHAQVLIVITSQL